MPTKPQTFAQLIKPKGPVRRYVCETDTRPSASRRGYDVRWQRYRAWYLAQHPLCEHCKARGRVVAASVADHVIPLSAGGAHCTESNTQALCAGCHNRKTATDGSR